MLRPWASFRPIFMPLPWAELIADSGVFPSRLGLIACGNMPYDAHKSWKTHDTLLPALR
jgi:hypothetical protein